MHKLLLWIHSSVVGGAQMRTATKTAKTKTTVNNIVKSKYNDKLTLKLSKT